MDEDRTADPARRGRLLSPTSGQPQTPPQTTQPQLPMDLASQYQRRFAPSVFLPPMAPPRLMQPSSSGFSAFTNYQSLPATTTPAPGAGSHLARSLPKPPPFSVDYLGPLPYSTGPAAGAAVLPRSPPSPAAGGSESASASGLPPRGAGHRRSRSDFLVGFSRPNQLPALLMTPAAGEYRSRDTSGGLEELFRSYRDPTNLVSSGGSGDTKNERNDHQSSSQQRGWSPADSSDNEAESWAASGNGNADSSSANHNPRHCRSLSVDSIMGNLNFGGMGGQASLRLPPPPPPPVPGAGGNLTRTGSGGASSGSAVATASSELANGEFTESEMNKIMANGRLAEIAIADPKRVKRILANRISAAKSKERKVKYMGELERKVRVLQVETSTLSSKAASSQRECEALKTMNNEMKIRLQAMEQQAQLKDALNEALTSEVQRLKHIAGEVSDPHVPNGSHHHINRQILEQHLQQLQQKQPSEAQQQQQQQQQESEQFKAQQKQWNH